MTEYDYSPQAWERYMETQQRIARWVDGTLTQQPCNAFSPATPHVQALKLKEEKKQRRREERRAHYDGDSDISDDHDSRYARSSQTRHRKSHSTKETTGHRSPRKERSRERERERDWERKDQDRRRDQERSSTRHYKPEKTDKHGHYDAEYVWVDRDAAPPSSSTRVRSSSQSVSSKPRPSQSSRSHTVPHLSLDLPAYPLQRQDPYYYHHRNSHSSQSSATTPNSGSTTHGMFPAGQVPPHSAPPVTGRAPVLGGHNPKPLRSQTMPHTYTTGYPHVDKNGYPMNPLPASSQPVVVPIRPGMGGSKSYGNTMVYAPDPSKAPQLPYSAYQSPSKSQSLLKRMFGFKAKNELIPQQQYRPPPQPTRDDKGSGRRVVSRKRSVSF